MKETIRIEHRLIAKCRDGDIKAQYQLYRMYSKAMYNIAMRFLDNKMDAEDILQESFLTAFKRLGELKDEKSFAGWLKRIVTNNCISLLRKKKISFEDIKDDKIDNNETLEENYEEEFDPQKVHDAIKELPEGARSILILRALEEYPHKEIAHMLSISVSTSKTQYSRALSLLKEQLKKEVYAE